MGGLKSMLLSDFVTEAVQVTTDISTVAYNEAGEMIEVPLAVEGILVDFDDEFILMGSEGDELPELINRNHVVAVRLIDRISVMMSDPNKPPVGEMC